MKILYFTQVQVNLNTSIGVYKKILSQLSALRNLNIEVDLISSVIDKNYEIRILGNKDEQKIIEKFNRKTVKITRYIYYRKVYQIIKQNKYDLIYIRYAQTAMPFFNNFLKKINQNTKTKILLEIPTYPYDNENKDIKGIKGFKIFLEKKYREKMNKYVRNIVTFTNDKKIWGIPCINISNGIDLSKVKIVEKQEHKEIAFISISSCCFWHGIDRFLYSLLQYKKNGGKEKIKFYIVGEGSETSKLKKIVEENIELQDIVIFHGFKSGEELDEVYNNSDIALGSLGFYRSGLEKGSTLKMREYCAKGLPFVVGYDDTSFSKDLPFYYQVSNDESLLDIEKIIEWYKNLKITPEEIRKYAEDNLSWDKQMKKVIDNI